MPFTSAAPFITTQDLEDILGRDVSADPGAMMCVDFACDMCRNYSGQTFNRGTTTGTFDGTGIDTLRLPETPVNAVTAVRVYRGDLSNTVGTVTTAGTWTTAGTADYALNARGELVAANRAGTAEFGSTWPVGRQNIAVTYDHGYDSVPRDVRGIAIAVASRMLVQGPALFENLGDQGIRYAAESTALMPTERLQLYRHQRR